MEEYKGKMIKQSLINLKVVFSKYQIHWHLGPELHSTQSHEEPMFAVCGIVLSETKAGVHVSTCHLLRRGALSSLWNGASVLCILPEGVMERETEPN